MRNYMRTYLKGKRAGEITKDGRPKKKAIVHKNAELDFEMIKVASRLVAAGFSIDDLGWAMGTDRSSIQYWKQKYPEFKQACLDGKKIAKQVLIAQALRAAEGYDYEVVKQTFNKDGNLEKTIRIKDHQKGDPQLAMFLLTNLDRQMGGSNWKNIKYEKRDETRTIKFKVDGNLDSEQIAKFAGRLFQAYSEDDTRKLVVSTEAGSNDSEGQGVQEDAPSTLPEQATNLVR